MLQQTDGHEETVQNCLESIKISSLGEWDVLMFLHRHKSSLVSAEQIARFVGYSGKAVGDALDRLESHRLISRSRSLQRVRFYHLAAPEAHPTPEDCFTRLIDIAETRIGRLLVIKCLRQHRAVMHIAPKGSKK
ncbi:MAG: MarR family transcriptional regulator [Bryobacteraceae bacterium]|nr:MarR family transcriptional regulator [Bryobacteraceae bacterium]